MARPRGRRRADGRTRRELSAVRRTFGGASPGRRAPARRLLDPAVRARFGATARPSVLRRTWTTVGDELVAHYGAVLDEFSVKCAVGVATPVPGSARPHVA
jgi:hypothetical protein